MARSLQKQLLVAVLGSLTALSAEAALVTYSNQAQFVAATGATSATGARSSDCFRHDCARFGL